MPRSLRAPSGYTDSEPHTPIRHMIVPDGKPSPSGPMRLQTLAQWACGVLLFAGLLGVLIGRSAEQRGALATSLLNVVAALVIAAAIATTISAIAWLFLRKRAALSWTRACAMTALCSLIAIAGLGAGANVLRLEAALRLQVGPDFVFISGAMPRNLPAQLEGAVHPSVPLKRVVLSNAGGSIQAALETAEWLRARGVRQAVVEGDCASACAVLALLIQERYLTPGAALGFHDLWGRKADSDELKRDRAEVRSRLDANGIDIAFIEPLMVGREMQYPDRAQLFARRIVTGCWSQTARAPEPCTDPLVSRMD